MATDNTFSEAMQKILQQLAVAGTLPDADLEFIATVQAAITQHLRQGAQQQSPQAQQGGPMGPQQGPPPMAQAGPGAPMGGLVPSAPNMDEIRRMVGSGQAQ